jgi:dihydroorotate dehydrogenase (NAD+) catalytic subunit
MSKSEPFYDPKRSYEDNYDNGPFGLFKELPHDLLINGTYELFGIPVSIPFGIPAGPLLTGKYITGAWNWGYSLATYKTVRGNTYPTHPYPNVIKVATDSAEIHPGETIRGNLNVDEIDVLHDGITNSFGVPSKEPSVWQNDVREALLQMKKGNTLILSFMGTKFEGESRDNYIENFAKTCILAKETGAPILEVNFSCPNFGKEGLICNDVVMSRDILESLAKAKGTVPLLVKIGYFPPEQKENLETLLEAIHLFADGVVAINTISAKVVDDKGGQILPGSPVRLSSGICGAKIRWAGLEMSERIMEYKNRHDWKDFVLIGVGGVTTPDDYLRYRKLGVDAVQSATGAMWNTDLAIKIRQLKEK